MFFCFYEGKFSDSYFFNKWSLGQKTFQLQSQTNLVLLLWIHFQEHCIKDYLKVGPNFLIEVLILAITNDISLNCCQLLFEAGKELVERPHKGLVGPEGRLGALLGAMRGTGARWARLRAVPRHLVDELLQPEHSLPVHSNVLQHRVQAVLQHTQREQTISEERHMY